MFITVRMPDGALHRLDALEGWRVMEVIRDWGLPIKAECGGARARAPRPGGGGRAPMPASPFFLNSDRTPPLVVGGGELAAVKARLLLKRAPGIDLAAGA